MLSGCGGTASQFVAADQYFTELAFHAKRVAYANDAGLDLYSEETQASGIAQLFSNRAGRAWWDLNRDAVAADAPRFRDRMNKLLVIDAPNYYQRLRAEMEKRPIG